MPHNLFNSLQEFKLKSGKTGKYYSLAALEKAGLGKVSRLPVSLRVVLESVLRNCDGKRVTEDAVKALAAWKPNGARTQELPFVLARIMLQDMAGFPALNDFAAMHLAGDPDKARWLAGRYAAWFTSHPKDGRPLLESRSTTHVRWRKPAVEASHIDQG